MRTVLVILAGAVVGFLTGVVLAEVIGVVGLLTAGGVRSLRWVRSLAFVLAVAGAAVAPVVDRRQRR